MNNLSTHPYHDANNYIINSIFDANKIIIINKLNTITCHLPIHKTKKYLDSIMYDPVILFLSNSHRTILSTCCNTDNELIEDAITINLVGMKQPLNSDSNTYKKLYNDRISNL